MTPQLSHTGLAGCRGRNPFETQSGGKNYATGTAALLNVRTSSCNLGHQWVTQGVLECQYPRSPSYPFSIMGERRTSQQPSYIKPPYACRTLIALPSYPGCPLPPYPLKASTTWIEPSLLTPDSLVLDYPRSRSLRSIPSGSPDTQPHNAALALFGKETRQTAAQA
jgi:hypothetical protein